MHRCKGVGGRHAEISIAAERVPRSIVPPFHPPGSNSDLYPPHMDRLLGPRLRNRTSRLRQSRYCGEADEVIDAIAKTVAELASQQNGLIRQQLIEQLIALRRRISP